MTTNVNSSTTNLWLNKSIELLESAGVSTARLDCLVLLADALGKDKSFVLAHPEELIDSSLLNKLDKQIQRRVNHEPLSYIRGQTEFYGREFLVNAHTLEPRPETENMIDVVKTLVKSRENPVIADVGTGSGCIAVSVKLEIPGATLLATDVDEKCVKTARENSKKLGADIEFYLGNLLSPLVDSGSKPYIIVANLPYVPDKYQLNKAAMFEPRHAIFGGEDGLDLYREIFAQIKTHNSKLKTKYVLTESLPFQHEELSKIAGLAGFKLKQTEEFIQLFVSK